jgi:electron transport complex protein RnfA
MSDSAQLAALAVFSSLSMNLLLRCGLGMQAAAGEEDKPVPFVQMGLLVVSVLILWLFFSYILPLGFFAYLLLFPGSALVHAGLEQFFFRIIRKQETSKPQSSGFCNGLTAGALFLTLNLASGFLEAAILSLGFALGTLLSLLILAEIRRRSRIEAVPRFLRGSPLALVSMGLLSLIFSSAAVILYRAFGG